MIETPPPVAELTLDLPEPTVTERLANGRNGWPILLTALPMLLGSVALGIAGLLWIDGDTAVLGVGSVALASVLFLGSLIALCGLTAIAPGEARVVQLLGRYVGTIRNEGLRWVNPITGRTKISTRIRNHETDVAKVNDADGNPIEIAAVVVWQVEDTAKASFEVDDFVEFVAIQSETAVRHIATSYPYDAPDDSSRSLRENAEEITGELTDEIALRVESAGVKVIESRITRLAYAPEIAQAMLRRQQAGAVVAARERIVEGAVGMVKAALAGLAEEQIVDLDEERKAAMVSNLLVVLCGDRDTQPVVNTGSLYH
jgi:regulator of protease activity HflC (stomatin/prohibitin superfamily)